jgi:hypothetical protein
MTKHNRIIIIIVAIFSVCYFNGYSQNEKVSGPSVNYEKDTLQKHEQKKELKNTLLINVTNPLLISSDFFTVTYERILPNNQSFTVSAGGFSIPRFVGDIGDSLALRSNENDKGFHLSLDYRFYLKKLNKYNAPRGVYIGPYYAYNHLTRGTTWGMEGNTFKGEVNSDIRLNIHTLGFELGYQFVFWNRLAVDLILFGPGFGSYNLKTALNTTLTPSQELEFFEKFNEYLQEKIPGFEWVVKPGEFQKKGSFDTWTVGYRYSVKVGFRF